jgi:predicted RNase H-like nuclease (RuvC/YqgF family)
MLDWLFGLSDMEPDTTNERAEEQYRIAISRIKEISTLNSRISYLEWELKDAVNAAEKFEKRLEEVYKYLQATLQLPPTTIVDMKLEMQRREWQIVWQVVMVELKEIPSPNDA